MSMIGTVKQAVKRLSKEMEKEGVAVDLSNVDYKALEADINDEYACGADGSPYDVIRDLQDSVGLEEYGIIVKE